MSAPPTTTPEPQVASAWVAVFALGLAYSRRPERERICELRDVTVGRPWLLVEARHLLASRPVAEPDICCEALRLLRRAEASSPLAC